MARRGLEGTIRRRGGLWQVFLSVSLGSDGRSHRRSVTCASEEEVRAKLLELNLAKSKGQLERLRPQDVRRLYGQLLANGVSVGMVHHIHRTLRAALTQAVTWGHLSANPAAKIALPRHTYAQRVRTSRRLPSP